MLMVMLVPYPRYSVSIGSVAVRIQLESTWTDRCVMDDRFSEAFDVFSMYAVVQYSIFTLDLLLAFNFIRKESPPVDSM